MHTNYWPRLTCVRLKGRGGGTGHHRHQLRDVNGFNLNSHFIELTTIGGSAPQTWTQCIYTPPLDGGDAELSWILGPSPVPCQ